MTNTPIATARITADIVALAPTPCGLSVATIRRRWDPYQGMHALPGGHVEPHEAHNTAIAAARELTEETRLPANPRDLIYIGTWADPNRDPRGRYTTDAYLLPLPTTRTMTAGDDASAAHWTPIGDALPGLAFDHADILAAALPLYWTQTGQTPPTTPYTGHPGLPTPPPVTPARPRGARQ